MTQVISGNNNNPDPSSPVGILNDVWDEWNHQLRVGGAAVPGVQVLGRTITFTGAAGLGATGSVPLFTVKGDVLVAVVAYSNTVPVGTSATLALGISGSTGALTTAQTATSISTGKGLNATGIVAQGTALKTTPIWFLSNGQNIIGTVATANITAGVLDFLVYFIPLTYGATITLS